MGPFRSNDMAVFTVFCLLCFVVGAWQSAVPQSDAPKQDERRSYRFSQSAQVIPSAPKNSQVQSPTPYFIQSSSGSGQILSPPVSFLPGQADANFYLFPQQVQPSVNVKSCPETDILLKTLNTLTILIAESVKHEIDLEKLTHVLQLLQKYLGQYPKMIGNIEMLNVLNNLKGLCNISNLPNVAGLRNANDITIRHTFPLRCHYIIEQIIKQVNGDEQTLPIGQINTLPKIHWNIPNTQSNTPSVQNSNPDAQSNMPEEQNNNPDAQSNMPDAQTIFPDGQSIIPDIGQINTLPNMHWNIPNTQSTTPNAQNNNPDAQSITPDAQNNNLNAQSNIIEVLQNLIKQIRCNVDTPNLNRYIINTLGGSVQLVPKIVWSVKKVTDQLSPTYTINKFGPNLPYFVKSSKLVTVPPILVNNILHGPQGNAYDGILDTQANKNYFKGFQPSNRLHLKLNSNDLYQQQNPNDFYFNSFPKNSFDTKSNIPQPNVVFSSTKDQTAPPQQGVDLYSIKLEGNANEANNVETELINSNNVLATKIFNNQNGKEKQLPNIISKKNFLIKDNSNQLFNMPPSFPQVIGPSNVFPLKINSNSYLPNTAENIYPRLPEGIPSGVKVERGIESREVYNSKIIAGNNQLDVNPTGYQVVPNEDKYINIYNKLLSQGFLKDTNLPNTIPASNNVVEITYVLHKPKAVRYEPLYLVKYRLPYQIFKRNLDQLVLQKPYLRNNLKLLYQELVTRLNTSVPITNISDLKNKDILNMVSQNGNLIETKFLRTNETNVKSEIKVNKIKDNGKDENIKLAENMASKLIDENAERRGAIKLYKEQINASFSEDIQNINELNAFENGPIKYMPPYPQQKAYNTEPILSSQFPVKPFNVPGNYLWPTKINNIGKGYHRRTLETQPELLHQPNDLNQTLIINQTSSSDQPDHTNQSDKLDIPLEPQNLVKPISLPAKAES